MSLNPLSFLKSQLNHVLDIAFQENFPALKARSFIPVNRSMPSIVETISARSWSTFGEAKVLNSGADDFPSVDMGVRETFAPVTSVAFSLAYSLIDLRRSQHMGMPLDARLGVLARQVIETKYDRLAVNGDEKNGVKGLLSHENSIATHKLTKWFDDKGKPAKSPDQMLSDINHLVCTIAEDTNNVLLPDTLLLPIKHFAFLAQTPYSAHSQVTILKFLLANNPYVKNVDSWVHLTDRCVLYPRTPQALEMYIPLEFEMLEPQPQAMRFNVFCHGRFGGVQVYTPKACAYGVGL